MLAHISYWITSVQFASAWCLRCNNMFFVDIQDYYVNLMLIEAGYLEMVKGVISFNILTGIFYGVLLNLVIGLSLLHVQKIR
ncbi:hypothetical protein AMTRI_Chr07g27530 [Amborella trichopoda]